MKDLQPFAFVTLLDMARYPAEKGYLLGRRVNKLICRLQNLIAESGNEHPIGKEIADECAEIIKNIRFMSVFFGLPQIKKRLERARYKGDFADWDLRDLRTEINELEILLTDDLKAHSFLYIPKEFSIYLYHGDLFGVAGKFPAADDEIFAAGNCYATGQFTACVFHLMRAVETCAKKMVRALKAEQYLLSGVYQNKKQKLLPVELCDWGKLIQGLETAVKELEKNSRHDTRQKERLVFYSHAIASFRNFKNAWRNKVSHGKHKYTAKEAAAIMVHTREFMTHLAKRLGSRKL